MINLGLSSSAFIGSEAKDILMTCIDSGVDSLEWTDDGFVPPGISACAQTARHDAFSVGLLPVSYSLLFRATIHNIDAFTMALSTAKELHAPILRIWSGQKTDTITNEAKKFYDSANSLGDIAQKLGITLCFSMARNSVLDSYDDIAMIFEAIDHPHVKLAWTPNKHESFDNTMEFLTALEGKLGLFLINHDDISDNFNQCSEDWYFYLDIFNRSSYEANTARPIILRSVPAQREELISTIAILKKYITTLNKYRKNCVR